jgi:hypothetical protein
MKKKARQSTLEALAGVVVLEDLKFKKVSTYDSSRSQCCGSGILGPDPDLDPRLKIDMYR